MSRFPRGRNNSQNSSDFWEMEESLVGVEFVGGRCASGAVERCDSFGGSAVSSLSADETAEGATACFVQMMQSLRQRLDSDGWLDDTDELHYSDDDPASLPPLNASLRAPTCAAIALRKAASTPSTVGSSGASAATSSGSMSTHPSDNNTVFLNRTLPNPRFVTRLPLQRQQRLRLSHNNTSLASSFDREDDDDDDSIACEEAGDASSQSLLLHMRGAYTAQDDDSASTGCCKALAERTVRRKKKNVVKEEIKFMVTKMLPSNNSNSNALLDYGKKVQLHRSNGMLT